MRCGDAQCSPGTRAAGLSPSCLLPLGDSVVLSKELVIHCPGVGSFPEGLGERKETRGGRGDSRAGREGARQNHSQAPRLQPKQQLLSSDAPAGFREERGEREINLKDGASAKKLIPSLKGTKTAFIYLSLWHRNTVLNSSRCHFPGRAFICV